MDTKVKGIVLKTVDYKEADKIASIFTLEEGIIPVKFVGVRRDKAKLKALSQPFSFCEFNMIKTKNHRTVISASQIDLFVNVTSDYSRIMCGYIVLDMIRSILPEEKKEEELFLATINAIKNIEMADPYIATIKFILQFLYFEGVGLEFIDSNYVYLNKATGEFSANREEFSYELDKQVYNTLKAINRDEEIVSSEKLSKQILKMLSNVVYAKFNVEIKSFEFI